MKKLKTNIIEILNNLDSSDIINIMIEGLKNPLTEIDMSTFGIKDDKICYGCAATNTLLKIYKIKNPLNYLPRYYENKNFINYLSKDSTELKILSSFERAINSLRKGDINTYNYRISRILDIMDKKNESLYIKNTDFNLPYLENNFTEKELKKYQELARLEKLKQKTI